MWGQFHRGDAHSISINLAAKLRRGCTYRCTIRCDALAHPGTQEWRDWNMWALLRPTCGLLACRCACLLQYGCPAAYHGPCLSNTILCKTDYSMNARVGSGRVEPPWCFCLPTGTALKMQEWATKCSSPDARGQLLDPSPSSGTAASIRAKGEQSRPIHPSLPLVLTFHPPPSGPPLLAISIFNTAVIPPSGIARHSPLAAWPALLLCLVSASCLYDLSRASSLFLLP